MTNCVVAFDSGKSIFTNYARTTQKSIFLCLSFIQLIKDNGLGFPQDFNLEDLSSLGLQLVQTLVQQLEGQIEIEKDSGSQIKIQFTELNYQSRF